MEKDINAPSLAFPQLPRPVFISYARRDFRIAYYIWQQMLSPDSVESHDQQVLMDFPPMIPPDMELTGYQANVSTADHPLGMDLGFEDGWSAGMPGWMVAIGANLIKCQSFVVVLTPHCAQSEAVDTELKAFEAFPDKPIVFLTINGTRIPERYARFERAEVYNVGINIRSLIGNILRAAYAAEEKNDWRDAGLLFTEAIHFLPLFTETTAGLTRDILVGRGRADMKLGYREQAIRMFEQAMELTDRHQPLLYAGALYNLGWAHSTRAHNEVGRPRESVEQARDYWAQALETLDNGSAGGEEPEETARLYAGIKDALGWADNMLNADQRSAIPLLLRAAGEAEQGGDWAAMRDHYDRIFGIYRMGQDRQPATAADMLSAKARAERCLGAWDEAQKTLEFALKFIGEEDGASRAGLLHDLGCVHCRRSNGHPPKGLDKRQINAAHQCWSQAFELLNDPANITVDNPRYDYAGLARACEVSMAWARSEIERGK